MVINPFFFILLYAILKFKHFLLMNELDVVFYSLMNLCVSRETLAQLAPPRHGLSDFRVIKIEIVIETEIRSLVSNILWVQRFVGLKNSMTISVKFI